MATAETDVPIDELRRRVAGWLARNAEVAARPPERGALSAATRAKIGERQRERHARQSLATATPLRRLRIDRELSQRQLARRAEVGVRSVQRAEVDPTAVSARTLGRLARALDAPADAIL